MSRLQQHYHVVVLNPKLGDINEQIQEVVDADGMIGLVVCSMKVIFLLPKIKIISSVTVGYDNYDVGYLNQKKSG